jgi:hypothetical protein
MVAGCLKDPEAREKIDELNSPNLCAGLKRMIPIT